MEMSLTIGKLAEALNKAQSEITGAKKTVENSFFKASYADLSSVWEACKEPLSKNGLSVSQVFDVCDDGVIVETILAHSSGEWIKGRMKMVPVKKDPQGIGSAATYARRYSLAAIVGVCPEDDDGEGAMGRHDNKKPSAQVAEKQGVAASSPPSPAPPKEDKNFAYLKAMREQKERVGEEQYYNMLGIHGFEKSNQVPAEKRKEVYAALKTLKDKEKVK